MIAKAQPTKRVAKAIGELVGGLVNKHTLTNPSLIADLYLLAGSIADITADDASDWWSLLDADEMEIARIEAMNMSLAEDEELQLYSEYINMQEAHEEAPGLAVERNIR